MNKLFTLSPLLLFCCCTTLKGQERNKNEKQNKHGVFRISSNGDSIVLTNGAVPFFGGVQVFRNRKSILNYTEKDLEIISNDSDGDEWNWYAEHRERSEYLYIIRIFNGPQPDSFLVIKATDAGATVLGKTEPNSAEIFGDIDHDGKFEIGGLTLYCQGGDPNCHPADHYRVFELAEGFPTDNTLTDFFKKFLNKK
jgi:hypothetical protein